ncbi:hypothetical protein PR202_ga10366 [Eleusine coracana subsp. coracana]|uniref:CASP-like protein n=1 Tax=Eleusine coracana subsp. coracana TaxID=191504 RepID=A0AAV5C6K0_ELECO|nr:hypothetical protein PR202_ga10366 [Eleusine coracana subsp. coracana]
MPSTPRTPAPDRPPPPVPPPPIHPPPPDPSPSPPGEEYHTPTPSFDASPRERSPPEQDGSAHDDGTAVSPKSPQLSPIRRFPSPNLLPPPASPTDSNGQERSDATATPSPAGRVRPQLHLAKGLVRTPSQGSAAAKSPSPSPSPPSPLTPAPTAKSPSPSPPSPLTPAPAPAAKSPSSSPPSPLTPGPAAKSLSPSPPSPLTPAPTVNIIKSNHGTPKRVAEAWKPLPPPPIAAQFDRADAAATSPLYEGKPRLDQARRPPAAAENGGGAAAVPPDVAAVARVGERRATSIVLRLATALLSLAAFSVMVSARTTGWAGDSYGRYVQYRYAVGVNVIVCAYSIAQCFGEVLAYLLMSASSAAASRNDLWVTRFGTDPFNKKINSALWLSFIAFLTLAANALISTANLFSML